ncbi:uncharacterized protein C1orf159 homolog isoform X2 [Catharus ustulatus]|uniref:uncharacterized protein C1orf159 homolog isoform X1 n=1 Tax=Catharus ustulatus TaxID=91951 RepID=UPI0014089B80|nr:uncharacterized protein C1orf159 homolog isoform X1 [Catharus ustulatus]XP_032935781.1 uncharacterized protein C1orf159 homolog isoform X2 [Catharus ustulatus]
MEVPLVLLLARLVAEIAGKSTENSVPGPGCCLENLDPNSSCPVNQPCSPGCYRRWNEDGSSSCVQCRNGTADCRDGSRGSSSALNLSTATPQILTLGGPEVAASLILGTFCLSLFLILSVASFFYLKRANKLPQVFYRRNKASVLQPSETASMISPPISSVRKPRYVRRERALSPARAGAVASRVSNV